MPLYRWILLSAVTLGTVGPGPGHVTALARAGQAQQQAPTGRGEPGGGAGGRGQAGRGGPAPIKNPVEGNADAIRAGGESYRARCASCHGADAKGSARGS